jgi:hypothetical protein
VQVLLPGVMEWLVRRSNQKIQLGYDVGLGYIAAREELINNLGHIVDNSQVMSIFEKELEKEKQEAIAALSNEYFT